MSLAYECDRCHEIGGAGTTWFQFALIGKHWGQSDAEGHLCYSCGSELHGWLRTKP